MSNLAIHGGEPVRTKPYPRYNAIGKEEKKAAMEVLDSGVLSDFMGVWGDKFLGGPRVRALEDAWAEHFNVKHAIAVNSATSGLYAAAGAAGIKPGDEVIVSPYTMVASVTAAVVYGGIPVFADIDPDIFCITPDSIRANITPKTKAIIPVDLFGHPADMDEIMAIAIEHNLIVIEDAAQAPGAMYHSFHAGTLGHIGVYSLNYHKQIHCGEGGMVVTDDGDLAERVRLIRNHAEVVVGDMGSKHIDLIGYNYRMGEIEAAIALEQLKKLKDITYERYLSGGILAAQLFESGITPPLRREGVLHAYYLFAMKYNGPNRDEFVRAVNAEGCPLWGGYVKPIYLEPMYQRGGYPYRANCPVTERMHFRELLYTNITHPGVMQWDLDDFVKAIDKVWKGLSRQP